MSIYFCSDWHFNHDREFVYGARGFQSVEEMNKAIIERHNSMVDNDDDVYVLGDLCLGGGGSEVLAANKALIEQMNGRLHIILGNHDTPARIEMYKTCKNVVDVKYADLIHYKGYHLFLTHFPCMTANLEKETLKQCTINVYGHTHQKDLFYQGMPFMFHCGADSHDCHPVFIDTAIVMMKAEVDKCKEQLQDIPDYQLNKSTLVCCTCTSATYCPGPNEDGSCPQYFHYERIKGV